MTKIIIGSDHGGYKLKEDIKKYIDLLSIVKINHLHLKFSNYKNFKINFKSIEGLLNESNEISYAYHEIKDLIKYANEKYVEIIIEEKEDYEN